MRQSIRLAFALVLAVCAAVSIGLWPESEASRNASGTYSLPLSPVVSGNTITSTWANTSFNDFATELTNSLDRGGRGAMTAPLQLANGTKALPGLTWGSDGDVGLYRIGANNPGMSVGDTLIQSWSTTAATFPLAVAVTGNMTTAAGITATQSTANTAAITSTGNGSGNGATLTGGLTGAGVHGAGGATSGAGVSGIGGGTNGAGGSFIGGADDGVGVVGVGDGSGAGASFSNGTDATGGSRLDAVVITNGDLDLSGVANPTSTTPISERLTPMNLPKAWGYINASGGGSTTVTVVSGFNVASAAASTTTITATIAADFAGTNNAVIITPAGSGIDFACAGTPSTAGTITIQCYDISAAGLYDFQASAARSLQFVVFGAQ